MTTLRPLCARPDCGPCATVRLRRERAAQGGALARLRALMEEATEALAELEQEGEKDGTDHG